MEGRRLVLGAVFLLTIASVISLTAPNVEADKPLPVSIGDQPDAPLKILEATSGYEDSGYTSNFYWRMRAKVRNISSKRIIAYTLQWIQYNAFDEEVDRVGGVDNDPLNAGAETTASWEKANLRGTGVKVTASVGRVRFEDGTTWTAVAPVGQAPGCADALKAERARLLQIYQTQGIDALLAELKK